MQNCIVNTITFPEFTGARCSMMPFIQGDPDSLPKEYRPYSGIVADNYLERGEIGFITIHESFVEGGKSQRGFNSAGIKRNVHIEVGRDKDVYCWGGSPSPHWGSSPKPSLPSWGGGGSPSWGGGRRTYLQEDTMVLIANSLSDTCRIWDTKEMAYTEDGDLSAYIDRYPEETGVLLKAGEVVRMSIFTPHECVNQKQSGHRQFFRIVGKGVSGREDYFTINPLVNYN